MIANISYISANKKMYKNAKQASCLRSPKASYSSWSMQAAVALLSNLPTRNYEMRESGIASQSQKDNRREECYQVLTITTEGAEDLHKADLELCIEDAATKKHTTHEAALKDILQQHKWKAEVNLSNPEAGPTPEEKCPVC
jgi:predicted ATPase